MTAMGSGRGPRIGLFGGSFDPPHIGHVALVEAALHALRLDEVWVVPVGQAVHRSLSGCTSAQQRLAWMQRVFAHTPRVRVLDWEVVRGEPTPSIVTLRRMADEQPYCLPVLLLGADAFAGIDSWVDYPAHAGLCDVAVFGRAESPAGSAGKAFEPVALQEWLVQPVRPGRRVDMDGRLPHVSATEIRQMAANGASLQGRVPECVRSEIEQAYAHGAA